MEAALITAEGDGPDHVLADHARSQRRGACIGLLVHRSHTSRAPSIATPLPRVEGGRVFGFGPLGATRPGSGLRHIIQRGGQTKALERGPIEDEVGHDKVLTAGQRVANTPGGSMYLGDEHRSARDCDVACVFGKEHEARLDGR